METRTRPATPPPGTNPTEALAPGRQRARCGPGESNLGLHPEGGGYNVPQASSPGAINATGALGMELSENTNQNSSGKLKQTPQRILHVP